MFLATFESLSTVFSTSETKYFKPRPSIFTSNFPLNLPNSSIFTKLSNAVGVRTSINSQPCCSAAVTASKVSERKTLPLLHVCVLGSFSLSLATVVPFPVPDRPWSVKTQPLDEASPSTLIMSSATSSAVRPDTLTLVQGSTSTSSGRTFFSTAILMPFASFSPSSLSRLRISRINRSERSLNFSSSLNCSMTAWDVMLSCRERTSAVTSLTISMVRWSMR
mmetsp:Transcript_96140/g.170622  ORF Transcript_96140/g.170622 Transcript_96140/m.170622 type:complete len:221 (+) Transcript_96140:526-1188(+)